ncbi:30S ribosomal protein S7 [bacterium]|nr:30S ribosomal protein S7 [bacterium]
MSRKAKKTMVKRQTIPDYKYNSLVVTSFIKNIMKSGKKSIADQIFYKAMDIIKEKVKEDPMRVLNHAMENVKPLLEVKSRRVGGATYQVPIEVNPRRSVSIAIRWITNYALARTGKSMGERLADELMEAARNQGPAVKKKEDTHKMAEANKAFAHYRW